MISQLMTIKRQLCVFVVVLAFCDFSLKSYSSDVSDLNKSIKNPEMHQINIITIDKNSVKWAEDINGISWPWPMEMYSYIVDFCKRGGARVVCFDIPFDRPSVYGYDDNDKLVMSIRSGPRVVLAYNASTSIPKTSDELRYEISDWIGTGLKNYVNQEPLEFKTLLSEATAIGVATIEDKPQGGVLRELSLVQTSKHGSTWPSLGLAAYIAYNSSAHFVESLQISNSYFRTGKAVLPLRGNKMLLSFKPLNSYGNYSAAAIIQSELRLNKKETKPPVVNPMVFSNSCVFVGLQKEKDSENVATPFGYANRMYIHAILLDYLIEVDKGLHAGKGTRHNDNQSPPPTNSPPPTPSGAASIILTPQSPQILMIMSDIP